ncbi:aminotransferase class I/II-fold pyridoxal phosphate-dependent enzyme [Nocardia xishanensis]|uniref:aminotransferase class I/II-fold pyridoxal phosphate-dependent enzyme n=1 Tax=Nocardia xishanensis TaxID=238964 RepID=UPI0033CC6E1C
MSCNAFEVPAGPVRHRSSASPASSLLREPLSGDRLPALKHLALRNSETQDDVCAALAAAPVVARLESLDISMGVGLATLGIGYGIAAPDLVAQIARCQLPFGMDSLADVAVTASYAAETELTYRIELINRERDHLAAALCGHGFVVPVSAANFLFIQCNTDRTVRLTTALRRSGIAVKSYDGTGVRITVVGRSASDAVMRILAGWEP